MALLLEELEYEKYQENGDFFFEWLTAQKDVNNLEISITGYTFCLLTLLKTNAFAKKFCAKSSITFKMVISILDGPCQKYA